MGKLRNLLFPIQKLAVKKPQDICFVQWISIKIMEYIYELNITHKNYLYRNGKNNTGWSVDKPGNPIVWSASLIYFRIMKLYIKWIYCTLKQIVWSSLKHIKHQYHLIMIFIHVIYCKKMKKMCYKSFKFPPQPTLLL